MSIEGPCCFFTDERPGTLGSPLPAGPKLGSVTLPPLTSTPDMAGLPLVPLPAPPGPVVGEIPP